MKYTTPEVEMVRFSLVDVIQTSAEQELPGGNGNSGDLNEDELEGF